MSNQVKTISVDGVDYVRVDRAPKPSSGRRHLVVMDRGWVFVGDLEEHGEGTITLNRAVNVRRWDSIGLNGAANGDGQSDVDLERFDQPVEVPNGVVLFRIKVCDDWGL